MIERLADGQAAITIEPLAGLIRVLCGVPAEGDEHPPYSAICTAERLTADELVLRGFAGSGVTRSHLALIARWAAEQGYRWIYADRAAGRALPRACRRRERPLAGWFECDLTALPLPAREAGAGEAIRGAARG